MGNNASSSGRGQYDETVDFGHLTPQGVYTGPRDWDQTVVFQLICSRRLAPFYRPLEEYDETWDEDQILAARKEFPPSDNNDVTENGTRVDTTSNPNTTKSSHKRPVSLKDQSKPEAAVYRGAVECPICFLYYPPNINHSRCCDQAICTECFVQIKRIDPTPTHLVSEPAACPYCVQDNFGIVYRPPPWRAGIGSESASIWGEPAKNANPNESPPRPTHKRRQKSYGAESPDVVLIDHIRPDWEAKLAAVKATVARRANRRIILHPVGDRLIPVGVTSGRIHPLSVEEARALENAGEGGGNRRSRRHRGQNNQNQNFERYVGVAGPDLEELMLMEAMRLSLIDHEEHQQREAEERRKQEAAIAQSEANHASTAGPSATLTSSNSTHPSSSPSTSSLVISVPIPHRRSQDFLNVPGIASTSSSFLGTSTPSPSASPLSGTPPRHGNARNHQTPSSAPYSTIRAAVNAAATTSAIFASDTALNTSNTTGEPMNNIMNVEDIDDPSRVPTPESHPKHQHRSGSPLPHDQISAQSTAP